MIQHVLFLFRFTQSHSRLRGLQKPLLEYKAKPVNLCIYRVYQNDWSGLEVDMVKRLINTSTNDRVTLQVYDTCQQMFLFFGLRRKDCLTRSTLSSDTRGRPALLPLQRHLGV
jgi:hypothetical protein